MMTHRLVWTHPTTRQSSDGKILKKKKTNDALKPLQQSSASVNCDGGLGYGERLAAVSPKGRGLDSVSRRRDENYTKHSSSIRVSFHVGRSPTRF